MELNELMDKIQKQKLKNSLLRQRLEEIENAYGQHIQEYVEERRELDLALAQRLNEGLIRFKLGKRVRAKAFEMLIDLLESLHFQGEKSEVFLTLKKKYLIEEDVLPESRGGLGEEFSGKENENPPMIKNQDEKLTKDLYRKLAKMIHPDLQTDELQKQKSHQLMQDLTQASKEKSVSKMINLCTEIGRLDLIEELRGKNSPSLLHRELKELKQAEKWIKFGGPLSSVYHFFYSKSDKQVERKVFFQKALWEEELFQLEEVLEEFSTQRSFIQFFSEDLNINEEEMWF